MSPPWGEGDTLPEGASGDAMVLLHSLRFGRLHLSSNPIPRPARCDWNAKVKAVQRDAIQTGVILFQPGHRVFRGDKQGSAALEVVGKEDTLGLVHDTCKEKRDPQASRQLEEFFKERRTDLFLVLEIDQNIADLCVHEPIVDPDRKVGTVAADGFIGSTGIENAEDDRSVEIFWDQIHEVRLRLRVFGQRHTNIKDTDTDTRECNKY